MESGFGVGIGCDKNEILLILDEVQCAYRTGNFFAFEKSGINPDIVPIAKGIGGGFPLGACLVTKKASIGMTVGTHGSTFGGNPLACSAGLAVLDILFEKDFLKNVKLFWAPPPNNSEMYIKVSELSAEGDYYQIFENHGKNRALCNA